MLGDRFYVEKDKGGKPKLFSPVYTERVKDNLLEITDYLESCCNTLTNISNYKRFYIKLDSHNKPIHGTLTNRRPITGNYADITLAYVSQSCCSTHVEKQLVNFNSVNITEYPVGVFNYVGDYLGDANTQQEYISIWNADPVNNEKALLSIGSNDFLFDVLLLDETFTGNLLGLNFFSTTFANNGNVTLHLDNDAVIINKTTDAIYYSNNYPVVNSDTNVFFNFIVPYFWHVTPTFNMRNVALTGYTAGEKMNIYHNNVDIVFAHVFTNQLTTIQGQLPTGLQYFFARGVVTTDYNLITNVGDLANLKVWATDHFGGAPNYILPSFVPTELRDLSQIEMLWLGETNTADELYQFDWVTAANFPVLTDLIFTGNPLTLTSVDNVWVSALPKPTNLLLFKFNFLVPSSIADDLWNAIGNHMTGVVPTGAQKRIVVANTDTTVTAASLSARNALTAAGWTLSYTV
jgi:hypothetical protein